MSITIKPYMLVEKEKKIEIFSGEEGTGILSLEEFFDSFQTKHDSPAPKKQIKVDLNHYT